MFYVKIIFSSSKMFTNISLKAYFKLIFFMKSSLKSSALITIFIIIVSTTWIRPTLHCLTILFNIPIGVSFTSPVFFKFHKDKSHVFQMPFLEAEGAQGHPGTCFWRGMNRVSLSQEDTEKVVPWETVSSDGTYFHQSWPCHPIYHSLQGMGRLTKWD